MNICWVTYKLVGSLSDIFSLTVVSSVLVTTAGGYLTYKYCMNSGILDEICAPSVNDDEVGAPPVDNMYDRSYRGMNRR